MSLVLNGCATSSPNSNSLKFENAPEFIADSKSKSNSSIVSKHNFHYGGNYTSPSPYVATKDGLYEVKPIFANSANLFYYDFKTLTSFFLCEKPECTHNNISCTSYIELQSDDAFLPLLLYSNEKLFIVKSSPSSSGAASIIQMDKNGANKTTLLKLEKDNYFGREFVFDDENIYYVKKAFNTKNFENTVFCQYNLKNKKEKSITDLSSDTLSLGGFSDECLYFLEYNDSSGTPTVNLLELNISLEQGFKNIANWNSSQRGGMVINEFLYLQDYASNKITIQNLQTNETTVIDTFKPLNNASASLSHAFANNLLLESIIVNEIGPPTVLASFIDFSSKTAKDFTLKMSYNNYPVSVIGEYGSNVCVIKDYNEKTVIFSNKEGVNDIQTEISREYALISKDDYRNSNPQYLTFTLAN